LKKCGVLVYHDCSRKVNVQLLMEMLQLNETALEKALDLVHSNNGTYIAVLYYAAWCPFSRELRPVYDVLSSVFPSIHHVAVEESSVRPW
jgi:thiol-disulfide isomerase/thioredoxin